MQAISKETHTSNEIEQLFMWRQNRNSSKNNKLKCTMSTYQYRRNLQQKLNNLYKPTEI